jgi:uncharacterized protein
MSVKITGEGKLLRIFVEANDQWHGKPLYHAIVELAKELGLAGATVLKGTDGFGANSRLRYSDLMYSTVDAPIIVEIVDSIEYIDRILPKLDNMVKKGLITIIPVQIIKYSHEKK